MYWVSGKGRQVIHEIKFQSFRYCDCLTRKLLGLRFINLYNTLVWELWLGRIQDHCPGQVGADQIVRSSQRACRPSCWWRVSTAWLWQSTVPPDSRLLLEILEHIDHHETDEMSGGGGELSAEPLSWSMRILAHNRADSTVSYISHLSQLSLYWVYTWKEIDNNKRILCIRNEWQTLHLQQILFMIHR